MSDSSSSLSSSGSSSPLSSPVTPPPHTPLNLHQNSVDPDAKWVVQKFGGTSVGKFAVQIAKNIVSDYMVRNKVAVVCSARSGTTKALGTTNLLLRAASETLRRPNKKASTPGTVTPIANSLFGRRSDSSQTPPDSPAGSSRSPSFSSASCPRSARLEPEFYSTIDLLRLEHLNAARSSVNNPDILLELEAEIESDCEWLKSFLFAAQVIDEISPRSKDTIIGLGERMACKIIAAVLRDQGIDAEYVSLESIVSDVDDVIDTEARSLDQAFYDKVAKAVGERVKQCGRRVPVVTGFFGPVPGSLLSQVGRGYTDLLSALLAVGLEASELQIWKEVDGIFTADPRKVPTARLIPIISPEEAAELTYYGSEVVHPLTMEQVLRQKIPIRIKNVENPTGGGTVIDPDADIGAGGVEADWSYQTVPEPLSLQTLHEMDLAAEEYKHRRLPTAVTIKDRIMVLDVNSNRKNVSHGFLAGIFGTLDRYGVVVDLISTSEVHVSMAIDDGISKKLLDRLSAELRKSGTVSVHPNMAILSLVGKHMRKSVGFSGRMFATLAQGHVNIEMTSQGMNEINISCVICQRDAVKALNLIHQSCLQIKPEGAKGRVGPWLF